MRSIRSQCGSQAPGAPPSRTVQITGMAQPRYRTLRLRTVKRSPKLVGSKARTSWVPGQSSRIQASRSAERALGSQSRRCTPQAPLPWPFLAAASEYHSWRRRRRESGLKESQQERARTTAWREQERARTMPMLHRARPFASGRKRLGKCWPSKSVQRSRDWRRLVGVLVAMRHLRALRGPCSREILLGDTGQVMGRLALTIIHQQTPRLVSPLTLALSRTGEREPEVAAIQQLTIISRVLLLIRA